MAGAKQQAGSSSVAASSPAAAFSDPSHPCDSPALPPPPNPTPTPSHRPPGVSPIATTQRQHHCRNPSDGSLWSPHPQPPAEPGPPNSSNPQQLPLHPESGLRATHPRPHPPGHVAPPPSDDDTAASATPGRSPLRTLCCPGPAHPYPRPAQK